MNTQTKFILWNIPCTVLVFTDNYF